MSSPESPLATFRRAYFEPIDQYMAWHDGFGFLTDLTCLDALAPAEQATAAAELLAALRAGTADARAMLGLGHLRYAEALPLLHDYVRRGWAALYALEAIAQINSAGLYPPIVASQLRAKNSSEFQLMDLLIGLREYFTLPQIGPVIPPLIFKLLTHSEFLVRHHALDTLRRLYGVETPEQAQNMERRMKDEIFSVVAKGGFFTNFGKAQRLLLAELPPATLTAFPLVVR
jgi:HEAT repeat protein